MSETVSTTTDPLIGKVIDGKYRILSLLGVGGMGSVYKAEHQIMQRTVALKVMNAEASKEPSMAQRFRAEAAALQRLDHPNILKVYEFGVVNGSPFLVLEYLEGTSLSDLIEQRGALPLSECKVILDELLAALEHAHSRGVLHRDIKPNNIVVLDASTNTTTSVAVRTKVVDFGLAKLMESTNSQKLTSTGVLLGTPLYMSPEQFEGKAPSAQSDLYSAACVMYESLSGKPPFQADNFVELGMLHVNSPVPPLVVPAASGRPPVGMEPALQKALAKKPEERFASAAEFAATAACAWQSPQTVPVELSQAPKPPAKTTARFKYCHKNVLTIAAAFTLLIGLFAIPSLIVSYARSLIADARVGLRLSEYRRASEDLQRATKVLLLVPSSVSPELESAIHDIGDNIVKYAVERNLDKELIRSFFSMSQKYWDSQEAAKPLDKDRLNVIHDGQWLAMGGLQLADYQHAEQNSDAAREHFDRLMRLTGELNYWSRSEYLNDGHFSTVEWANQLGHRARQHRSYQEALRYYQYGLRIASSDSAKSKSAERLKRYRNEQFWVGIARADLGRDENDFALAQQLCDHGLYTEVGTVEQYRDRKVQKGSLELAQKACIYSADMNKWIATHPLEIYRLQLRVMNYLQPYYDNPVEKKPGTIYEYYLLLRCNCGFAAHRAHLFKEAERLLLPCMPAYVQLLGADKAAINCSLWLADALRKQRRFESSCFVADAGLKLSDLCIKRGREDADVCKTLKSNLQALKKADRACDADLSLLGVQ